jgi:hypothetical protein
MASARARKATWTLLVALLSGGGLPGCQPKAESYYPLTPGSSWRYVTSGEVRTFAGWVMEEDGIHRGTVGKDIDNFVIEVSTQPPRDLAGREATPMMTSSELHQGFWFSFWVRDGLGIAEVGRQPRGASEPTVLKPPVYALRFPLAVGTTWDTSEPAGFGADQLTLEGTAHITSISDSVTVPAGTFRRCVRIDSEAAGQMRVEHLYGRNVAGDANFERNTTLWLAPDVGPVKYVSRERMTPSALGSGEQTLELMAFTVK